MSHEHLDVLVVGAGLSGIGAGYRLQSECPGLSYAILEGRADLGGTWDLFRYPGIRSDSDMFTLGYPFRPWAGAKSIADGDSILTYIRETAEENGIDRHIRFDSKVVRASWSSETSTWTVDVVHSSGAAPTTYTCGFLYMCSGYYSYEGGYQPDFPGIDRFRGTIVHPQHWPEDLDYRDKKVVIIGSGATAVTLVPAMATDATHVTMLQRSPTYITALPGRDGIADWLRQRLPAKVAHPIVRWKNVLMGTAFYQLCRRRPGLARRLLTGMVAKQLPEDLTVDPHFTPTYDPWDQRLCLVPDGDLFESFRSGRATVVTDEIQTFTQDGIALCSGTHLDADIVITATGLTLVACGGVDLDVDGEEVVPGERLAYKGHMLSGVPNMAMCVGYTNASWTLRADLTSKSVCRLLNHMEARGYTKAVPTVSDPSVEPKPILGLSSGYVQRGIAVMPKQGTKDPWLLRQNYILDFVKAKVGRVGDSITFTRDARPTPAQISSDAEADQVVPADVPVGASH